MDTKEEFSGVVSDCMNCFAHALPYLDDAYLAVGNCLPDWLSACDRKCRVPPRDAAGFVDDPDPIVSAIASGVAQHHHDDEWFHKTPVFREMNSDFAAELRKLLDEGTNVRPSFAGHILVEMLLDAYLNVRYPGRMEFFYYQVGTVDGSKIQDAINLFSSRPTDKLAPAIGHFVEERFLFDYDTDEGILYRLNRVFSRLRLSPLDDAVLSWLPGARRRVSQQAAELLPRYPLQVAR